MNEPNLELPNTRPLGSSQRLRLVCLLFGATVAACGSSAGSGQPGPGAGDSPGGASGQGAGGNGTGAGGTKPTSGAGGTNGGAAGASGSSGTGALSGGAGKKGSGIDLAYCPEEAQGSGYIPCATDADCSGGAPVCRSEPYIGAGACGACFLPPATCTSDSDCAVGVCVPFSNPCACTPGLRTCAAACTATSCESDEECAADGHCVLRSCASNWSCAPGFRCNTGAVGADTHGCQPIPCDDGYTCPAHFTCSKSSGIATDRHGCSAVHCSEPDGYVCPTNRDCSPSAPGGGCVIRKCSASSDCACGTCIGGACATRPNFCLPYPPA